MSGIATFWYNLLLGTTDETSYSGGFTRYAAHGAVFVD